VDLTFGLTEGWWKFTDVDLRPSYPLLPATAWRTLLLESAFESAEVVSHADAGVLSQQSVLVARVAAERVTRRWVVWSGGEALGGALASALAGRGDQVELVVADDSWDATDRRAVEARWRAACATGSVAGVIHTASVAAGPLGAWDTLARTGWGSVLALTQALAERPARLWIVTEGAQAVVPGEALPGVGQAAVWGLARVVAREHPELGAVCVDVDPAGEVADAAAAVIAEVALAGAEAEVGVRGGVRRVARLAPRRTVLGGTPPIRADRTYWVTGGSRGLGLLVGEWLAAAGARALVLQGRQAASAAARARVAALEATGVRVRLVAADVADAAAMQAVAAEVTAAWPPVGGVVHAAGVVDDRIVVNQTPGRMAGVLAPKVTGAWHLHQLLADAPLDFFVLFSSAAALLGLEGQSSYAAANAFLDAFAHARRAQGLPAVSISWGPWARSHAAVDADLDDRRRRIGLELLDETRGRAIFLAALEHPPAAFAAMRIDWTRFAANSPLYADLRKAPVRPASRRALVVDQLRAQVASLLGRDAATIARDRGLFEMGVDSLASLELRGLLQASFGLRLPATLAFSHPTIDAMADYVLGRLGVAEPMASSLDELSDDEIARRLADKLDRMS
jgi:NAD(P)-dependent dehydrogenase (short-subunit alcohol dehydrogenase family)/acyl carrier protein